MMSSRTKKIVMKSPLRSEGGEGERPGEWMGWGFCGFFFGDS